MKRDTVNKKLTINDLQGEVCDMLNSARVVRSFIESELHHLLSLDRLDRESADAMVYLVYDAENRAELLHEKFHGALQNHLGSHAA
ncbi:hypothetical protein [Rhizobium mesoamericanum]|uniref:hypothetical protein n=1 Tax=Rhizobium mesoamericanum TaxID=1079800 RepID=UPI00048BD987|nr:hypothetical protein [Rhizobium mesoamericanum]